ncbi:CD83 antigen [Salarias fasciatus]|uniref:Ig-like domain-containing protein n=1 Tax=Salarias fasciatus TaxID=181472 RepID=A0A672GJT1_SALFA|nr:CD83 antigen [Salarias fasciatus]
MSSVYFLLLLLELRLAASTDVSQGKLQVEALPGDPCTLQCTAKQEPGVQYISVRWYKVIGETRYGLISKSFPNGTTRWYADVDRRVQLVEGSLSISLPSADCDACGEYMCSLSAPVGQQNRDGRVQLVVKDCPVSATENATKDYLIIIASAVLIVALVIFFISYSCLKKTLKGRNKSIKKEILLDGSLRPLDKKDLMLIYTLGPKTKTSKHLYV